MLINNETKILEEGKKAETSPAEDAEEIAEKVELNNAPIPTAEEAENGGIISPLPDTEEEPVSEMENAPLEEKEIEPEAPIMQEEAEVEEEIIPTEANAEPMAEEMGGEVDPNLGMAESSTTKMFTQSQVDEIAGKARKAGREKAIKDTFARYGVNSEEELDELFGDAQRLFTLQDMYDADKKRWEEADLARNSELSDVKERVALLESGIDKNRYEDAKLILRGKGLEVNSENILKELATHPEWKVVKEDKVFEENGLPFRRKISDFTSSTPARGEDAGESQIKVLGNVSTDTKNEELSDYDKAMRMFRLK